MRCSEGGVWGHAPPRTSPDEDPRRVPERGARALPAPPADLVVRTRGPLAVRASPDVGVKPESAPQWLPSHGPPLVAAAPAGRGVRPAPLPREDMRHSPGSLVSVSPYEKEIALLQ